MERSWKVMEFQTLKRVRTLDEPNINKIIWSMVNNVFFDEGRPGLMPCIPYNIHVVHNAFLVGI